MTTNKPVIALLGGMNLTAQNVYRTGVEYLEKQFEVVVFDCRPFLQRPIDPRIEIDPRFRRVYQLTSLGDLVSILQSLKPVYAIDFIGPCREMKLIQPALRIAGCKFVIQKLGQLPQPSLFQRRLNQFLFILKLLVGQRSHKERTQVDSRDTSSEVMGYTSSISKVRKIVSAYFETKYYGKADIALAAGRQAIKSSSKMAHITLSVKSTDSHMFAQATRTYSRDHLRGISDRYALFIDDALVHATDWALLRQESPVEATFYYRQLNNFLSQIEKSGKISVIIAGHPQALNNLDYISKFDGRPVYFDCTPNLVLGCRFAIAHASTAISFAVISDKPMVIVSNSELDKGAYGRNIRNMAKALGVSVNMMDHFAPSITVPQQPNKQYAKYRQKLLYDKNCVENEPWEEFLSFTDGTES
jgi:hypothetical protein